MQSTGGKLHACRAGAQLMVNTAVLFRPACNHAGARLAAWLTCWRRSRLLLQPGAEKPFCYMPLVAYLRQSWVLLHGTTLP